MTIDTELTKQENGDYYIALKEDGKTLNQLKYALTDHAYLVNFLVNDTERGLEARGPNKDSLAGYGKNSTKYEEAISAILLAAKENQASLQGNISTILSERLDKTDGSPKDAIKKSDIENVHEAVNPHELTLEHIGKNTNDDARILLHVLSIKPFYDSLRRKSNLNDAKTFIKENEGKDIALGKKILEKYGLDEIESAKLTYSDAKFKKDFGAKQEKKNSDEKGKENSKGKEAQKIDKLAERFHVTAVQRAFGMKKPNGVYDPGTKQVVRDHIHGLLEGAIIENDEGKQVPLVNGIGVSAKGNPTILVPMNKNEFKKYEFVKEATDNEYFIYELDEKGKPVLHKNDKNETIPAPKMNIAQPHPALIEFMRKAKEHAEHKQQIENTNTFSKYSDINGRRALTDEELDQQKVEETNKLIKDAGLNAQSFNAALLGEVDVKNFDKAAFIDSDVYKKIQKDISKKAQAQQDAANTSMANFIAVMQGLQSSTHNRDENAQMLAAGANFKQADSLLTLFSFMNNSPDYNPDNYENLIKGRALQDNILSESAYSLLSNSSSNDLIGIHTLYENKVQESSILEYFGERNEATKAEILQYHRIQFDLYAIKCLSGETPEKKGKEQSADDYKASIDKFIEDRAHILKNVTLANEGKYIVDGKPVWFNPPIQDIRMAWESFGTPTKGTPEMDRLINNLQEKGIHPAGYNVTDTLSAGEQAKLFAAAFSEISLADTMASCDEITKHYGYNVPAHAKGKISGYDVNTHQNFFLDHPLPTRRRDSVAKQFKALEGLPEAALEQAYKNMSPQDRQSFLGAIFEKQHAELNNDALYKKVADKFYEQRLSNGALVSHRASLYNDRYAKQDGEYHVNKDLMTQQFLRANCHKLEELLGHEAAGAFYHDKNDRLYQNLDITHDEVIEYFNKVDPSGESLKIFNKELSEMTLVNGPTWYLYQNEAHYEANRIENFIPQVKTDHLLEMAKHKPQNEQEEEQTNDAETEDKPETENDKPENQDTPEVGKDDNPLNLQRLPVPDVFNAATIASASTGLLSAQALSGAQNVRGMNQLAKLENKLGSDRAHEVVKALKDLLSESKNPELSKEQSNAAREAYKEYAKEYGLSKNALTAYDTNKGKLPSTNEIKVGPPQKTVTTHTPEKETPPSRKGSALKEEPKNNFKQAAKNKTSFKDRYNASINQNNTADIPEKVEKTTKAPTDDMRRSSWTPEMRKGKGFTTVRIETVPQIKKPGALTSVFRGVINFIKGAGRISKTTVAGALVGAVIGGTINSAEAAVINENAERLYAMGQIDKDTLKRVNEITDKYVLSGLDPSPATEILLKIEINALIEEKNLDPVIAKKLFPTLTIDLLDAEEMLTAEQRKDLKTTYSQENLEKLYAGIAKKHNLPKMVPVEINGQEQEIPIGTALLDDGYRSAFLKTIQDGTTKEMVTTEFGAFEVDVPTYNEPQKTGFDSLIMLNAMAGTALQTLENDSRNKRLAEMSEGQRQRRANIGLRNEYRRNAKEQQIADAENKQENQPKTTTELLSQNIEDITGGTKEAPESTPKLSSNNSLNFDQIA